MSKVGIYNPNLTTRGGGEKVCLALAEVLSKEHRVVLITEVKGDKSDLEEYFGVDLSNVEIVLVKTSRITNRFYRMRIPEAIRNTIKNFDLYRKIATLKLDVFINNAYNTELSSPAPHGVYMCMFPHKLPDRSEMGFFQKIYADMLAALNRVLFKRHWLDTYQTVTANSIFTQSYIKKYWDRSSDILYPICDDALLGGVAKQKIILNVGRFFHNNGVTHHKRQDFLVDTFLKMNKLHEDGWQLHLAGTVNENYADVAYVMDIMRRSDGYPVYFHFDMPLHRLRELYSQASLYWHATGFGSNASKNPERQEHFGISTVEAMSAKAVPVVINSAGQREIVHEGQNGYLWKNQAELERKTMLAIAKNQTLAVNARRDAHQYDKQAFYKQAQKILQFKD